MTHRVFRRKGAAFFLFLALLLHALTAAAAAAAAGTPSATPAQQYKEVTLSLGSVTKTVIATGSLRFDVTENLTAPEDVTLSAIDVRQGDSVKAGQVLAHYNTTALADAADAAKTELETQDDTVQTLFSQQAREQSIKPAVAGVVKALNVQAGQMLQASLQDKPIAVLSTDGFMQVRIMPVYALSLNQTVRVRVEKQSQTGAVTRLYEDGSALISFADTRALEHDMVEVTLNGLVLGEGRAEISRPYELYTDVDGVVDSVAVKVNASVTQRTVLAKVTYADESREYREALEKRAELAQRLDGLEALMKDPVYRSPMDGIVAEVTAQTGQAASKDTSLFTLYPTQDFVMDVSVDELDILSVKEGQKGTVALDALKDTPLAVTVEQISRLGSASSGITTYPVTLSVEKDSRLLSGMNGTMTLNVGEEADTVLVPLAALMNDRQGNYVLLKDTTLAADAVQTGIKTYVKVGLSDADYAAVTSGLKAGDVVLVRSTAAQSESGQSRQRQGFGQMQPPEGFGPGGNDRPNGGQRP